MSRAIISGPSRGFTLIEMLVVLMIMGLFIGLVSTITRPDDRGVLKLEAPAPGRDRQRGGSVRGSGRRSAVPSRRHRPPMFPALV